MKLNELMTVHHAVHDSWGYHLMLDCKSCDRSVIMSVVELERFVQDLIIEIGMVAHGPTIIDHFPNREPGKTGFSLMQFIETSSITGHFIDATGDAYLDIFSCKKIPVDDALEFVKSRLNPEKLRLHFISRSAE